MVRSQHQCYPDLPKPRLQAPHTRYLSSISVTVPWRDLQALSLTVHGVECDPPLLSEFLVILPNPRQASSAPGSRPLARLLLLPLGAPSLCTLLSLSSACPRGTPPFFGGLSTWVWTWYVFPCIFNLLNRNHLFLGHVPLLLAGLKAV